METFKNNVLDRLIDQFSATDLKKRVWGVTVLGFAICLAIAIGGYLFLRTSFTVEAGYPKVPYGQLLWMGR
jgi:hypothetical protein